MNSKPVQCGLLVVGSTTLAPKRPRLYALMLPFFLFEVFALAHGQDTKHMPNVGYALAGYNVFKGNPMATDPLPLDPGFGAPVFAAHYTGQTTDDKRYFVPDGFYIRSALSCNIGKDSSAKISKTTSDYQKSLQAKASFETKALWWSASFSSSTDYKSADDETKTQNTRIVSSAAECSVYRMAMLGSTLPNLTSDFADYVNKLPEDYGYGGEYFDLFEKYGTHVMDQVTMGARYGFSSTFDETAWNTVTSTGLSVSTAASLHAFVNAGGTLSDDTQIKAEAAFSNSQTNSKEISLGSKPTDGDADKWAQESFNEPLPIGYMLKPICDILPDASSTPPSLKQQNCWYAAKDSEYCRKQLLAKQKVPLCTGESPLAYVRFAKEDGAPYGFDQDVMALSTPVGGSPSWKGNNCLYWKYGYYWSYYSECSGPAVYRWSNAAPSSTDPTVAGTSWYYNGATNTSKIIETSGCKWDDECSRDQKCSGHQCISKSFDSERGRRWPRAKMSRGSPVTKGVYV